MIKKLRKKLLRTRHKTQDEEGRASIESADRPGHDTRKKHELKLPLSDYGAIKPNVPFESRRDTPSISMPQGHQQVATSTLQGAHDFTISGTQFINVGGNLNNVSHYNGSRGMDILEKFASFNALHDSSAQDPSRQCHAGTRENILKKINDWADNIDTQERILWLHGPAGVGKSAIAQTVAYSYGSEKLAASFFFFRSDSNRNDGNRLFPTLAWQLAFSIPALKQRISVSLEDHPDLPRKAVEIQFKHLIAQPLLEATAENSPCLRTAARLVIIDGVDECKDGALQRRFLEVLCKASGDECIPLRFLICSRPEAQIKDVFDQFQPTVLEINLADVDDAYRDIEKYFQDQFVHIASNQNIDSETWPGKNVIDDFVAKSSGQFVYASTITKFVNDEYSSAISQLDIILGLKPGEGESPFAELDALYMEILQRQPQQAFLKEFLTLLIARTAIGFDWLANDDSILLNISGVELHRKLRGMHSLLKFEPHIDVHHKSFLEFLEDSARSSEFYVTHQAAVRRYVERIVEVLVRHASRVLKDPDIHGTEHFDPVFGDLIRVQPDVIELPLEDLNQILQPLYNIRDELLRIPMLIRPWKRGNCANCSFFYIMDDLLLYNAFLSGMSHPNAPLPLKFGERVEREEGDHTFQEQNRDKWQSVDANDTKNLPSSLLAELLKTALKSSTPCAYTVNLFGSLLQFDPERISINISSVSDAQKLVDLIFYMVNYGSLRPPAAHDTAQLAFVLYARIPVIPQYLFLNGADLVYDGVIGQYQGKSVQVFSWTVGRLNSLLQSPLIASVTLDDGFISFLGICKGSDDTEFNVVWESLNNGTVRDWRKECNPAIADIEERILEVAKAIRLIHSLGIVLDSHFSSDLVLMDSEFHCKLLVDGMFLQYIREVPERHQGKHFASTREADVERFGFLFYEIYFNIGEDVCDLPTGPPSEPAINDDTWHLIQRCCAEDPELRPTMSDIVEEMESWK